MGAFWDILVVTATTFVLVACLGGLSGGFGRRTHPFSSTRPVLGGGTPTTHAWSRFHVRFYPMALLFIAFEMEMMFMYPWAVVYVREGLKALAEMGMFLTILSVGIAYAWREGAFEWQ